MAFLLTKMYLLLICEMNPYVTISVFPNMSVCINKWPVIEEKKLQHLPLDPSHSLTCMFLLNKFPSWRTVLFVSIYSFLCLWHLYQATG